MKSHTPFDWRPGGYRGFNMRDADILTSVLVRLFFFFFFFFQNFSLFFPLRTEAFLGTFRELGIFIQSEVAELAVKALAPSPLPDLSRPGHFADFLLRTDYITTTSTS